MPVKKASTTEKELMRKLLGSIEFSLKDFLDSLSPDERSKVLSDANMIFTNSLFKKIYDYLASKQLIHNGQENDTERQMVFSRGTINGMGLYYETVEDLNSEYLDSLKKNEEFDKFSTF